MLNLDSVRWKAPAKLNLFLHITGRRDDGYHLLQTVFQFLDIHDEIIIRSNTSGEIVAQHAYDGLDNENDLTLRAARLLKQHTGVTHGAQINLIKNLPVGGGVGGGSSDAATVLKVLNALWMTGLRDQELAALGVRLGADIPVFINGESCWAEGVGDEFQDIELPEPTYLLVYPKVHVSTAKIFSDQELTRNTSPIRIADFLEGLGHNDCEPVVRSQVPEVDEAMKWLDRFSQARLTGTGGCVFAEFDSREEAMSCADSLQQDWQVWVTRGCNHSPLHEQMARVFD